MMEKIPFLVQMKKTLKSLDEARFEVKENSSDYAVHLKSVIVVGPIPEKQYAEKIAGELNAFIESRKSDLNKAIEQAEKQCESIYFNVVSTISGGLSGQPKDVEDVLGQHRKDCIINKAIADNEVRQFKVRAQPNSNEVQLPNDENQV